MKIAIVSAQSSPLTPVGGVEAGAQQVHVAALATALGERGHAVTVYTRAASPELPRRVRMCRGVTVEHVDAGPLAPLSEDELVPHLAQFGRGLAASWAVDTPELVHSHFWSSGLVALAAAREFDLPVVHSCHALGVVKHRHLGPAGNVSMTRRRLERAMVRQLDRLVASSTDEAVELVRMGADRRRITVLPRGVDTELFRPEGEQWTGSGRPRLVMASRLIPRKGIDTVLAALSRIPDAELFIAGGPIRSRLEENAFAQRLRGLAQQMRVADRVEFLGSVDRRDLPTLYRSADLMITTPWYEPYGTSALEAMACGVPVVATEVGSLTDIVADGSTGELLPIRRPDLLAGVVRRLLGDPVRREAYGIAGADRARVRYGWQRLAEGFELMYERTLRARYPEVGLDQELDGDEVEPGEESAEDTAAAEHGPARERLEKALG